MVAPLVGAALIGGGTSLLGGLLSGAGKGKQRKHEAKMLREERAWQERMRKEQWGESERRHKAALERVAPEQGFIPTYQKLKEISPLLTKLIGGNVGKYFGGKTAEEYGIQGLLDTIAQPDYTGFEQEQSYAEKAAQQTPYVADNQPPEYTDGKLIQQFKKMVQSRKTQPTGTTVGKPMQNRPQVQSPQYFKDKFGIGGGRERSI